MYRHRSRFDPHGIVFLVCLTAIAFGLPGLSADAGMNSDNGPGCGLGKLAWMDYGGQKQIAPQVMMATTNGTFGSQTFGISFGTSGCTNDGVIMKNKHVHLAATASESLAEEMARGEGEHLASLASLLGVPREAHDRYGLLVQARYANLSSSQEIAQEIDGLVLLEVLHAALRDYQGSLSSVASHQIPGP